MTTHPKTHRVFHISNLADIVLTLDNYVYLRDGQSGVVIVGGEDGSVIAETLLSIVNVVEHPAIEESETRPALTRESVEGLKIQPDEDANGGPLTPQGWSLSVGTLLHALKDLPSDTEVMLSNAEVGDIDIADLHIETLYPEARGIGAPPILVLGSRQVVSSEYAYPQRMDAAHLLGNDSRWDDKSNTWRTR